MCVFYVIGVLVIFYLMDKYYPKYRPKNEEATSNLEVKVKSKKNALRYDGYYHCHKKVFNSSYNEEVDVNFLLFLNSNGFGNMEEGEGVVNVEKDDFLRFKNYTKLDRKDFSEFSISDDFFSMKIYRGWGDKDYDEKVYELWYGKISNNKLILNYDNAYYNYALVDYTVDKVAKNLEFNFTRV